MEIEVLDHKQPMAKVIVDPRHSGKRNAVGQLIRVLPAIRRYPAQAMIQFSDGIEPVDLEHVYEIDDPEHQPGTLSLF